MRPQNPPPASAVPVYETQPRSGNEVNGRGVQEKFRPRHVFHSTPGYYGLHDWWLLNRFFMSMGALRALPQSLAIRWHIRNSVGPVAKAQQPVADPAAMAAEVKAMAKKFGATIVGITRLDESAFYEHTKLTYKYAICFGIPMDREEMSHIPHTRAATEVLRIYKELAITGNKLAAWIRDRGWPAKSYGDSMSTDIMHIPLAIQAGLGELGKHGSLICKEHGSNVRISTVVTDLPMALDSPVDIAVDDLCATCRRCTLDCPPGAIGDQKQWVRGELRWYVDFDKCAPYFSITGGCAICIEVCPWSEDGRGEQLSAQLLKKRAAKTKKPVPADAG